MNLYSQKNPLPENFVYVKDVIPGILLEMRYAGKNNFIGKPIEGYRKPVAILSRPAALALKNAQQELNSLGYSLKIFDAYRPQTAVNHFVNWAKNTEDTLMKKKFYPAEEKKNLFQLGYLSSRSGHSRGSTLDLTLVKTATGKELDMGGSYDFFGNISAHNYEQINPSQKQNRKLLKTIMVKYGFVPYAKEWWHYTYQPEPFPDTYFDFPVE